MNKKRVFQIKKTVALILIVFMMATSVNLTVFANPGNQGNGQGVNQASQGNRQGTNNGNQGNGQSISTRKLILR